MQYQAPPAAKPQATEDEAGLPGLGYGRRPGCRVTATARPRARHAPSRRTPPGTAIEEPLGGPSSSLAHCDPSSLARAGRAFADPRRPEHRFRIAIDHRRSTRGSVRPRPPLFPIPDVEGFIGEGASTTVLRQPRLLAYLCDVGFGTSTRRSRLRSVAIEVHDRILHTASIARNASCSP